MATWQQTTVAVKILLNTSLDMYSREEAARQALTLSSPALENLQKVPQGGCCQGAVCCVTTLAVANMPARRAAFAALLLKCCLRACLQEAGLMAALRHRNIVNFLGVCAVSEAPRLLALRPRQAGRLTARPPTLQIPPCVVTECCERGSLSELLRAVKQSDSAAAKLAWGRRLHLVSCAVMVRVVGF